MLETLSVDTFSPGGDGLAQTHTLHVLQPFAEIDLPETAIEPGSRPKLLIRKTLTAKVLALKSPHHLQLLKVVKASLSEKYSQTRLAQIYLRF